MIGEYLGRKKLQYSLRANKRYTFEVYSNSRSSRYTLQRRPLFAHYAPLPSFPPHETTFQGGFSCCHGAQI